MSLAVRLEFPISWVSSVSCSTAPKDLVATDMEKSPQSRLFDNPNLGRFVLVSYFRHWLDHST